LLQSKKHLEEIVEARTKDITIEKEKVESQKLQLENIHTELSERNKDVMDSIKYAQRIQTSILPPLDKFKTEFNESFIFYKPRDIVSGDFYWFEKTKDFFVMACADCTGHGVPGAFMSMIGTTLLNKIVEKEEVVTCQQALSELDKEMQKALRQEIKDDEHSSVDGMDIALIAVNLKDSVCHYSGAYRPLYLIRDNELVVYKSNRVSIGGGFAKDKLFKGESIDLKSGDQLYMFTDGFTDQFGGEKNKKFKRDRLKKLLLENCKEAMNIQQKKIEQAFSSWKGDNEQIDDVLLVGIQIP
jgi:serine phosphatase RsbU (regulator of sigma subunit)